MEQRMKNAAYRSRLTDTQTWKQDQEINNLKPYVKQSSVWAVFEINSSVELGVFQGIGVSLESTGGSVFVGVCHS